MKKSSDRAGRSTPIDCLGLGIMPLDLLFEVDSFPEPDHKRDAKELTIQGGGPVPNVLVGLRRLGHKVAPITVVADDIIGRMGINELKSEGVDTRYIVKRARGRSDTAGGYVERESGRRTIVLYRTLKVRPADIKTATLPHPRVIHLDGRDLEACMKLARWGRKIGAEICFDVGSMRNDVSPIFPLIDHLVVADAFALPFTRTHTARDAIKKLQAYCSGTIVVTEGTRGSVGYGDGNFVRQRAFRVPIVDTTGAGDAFHTGYIHGLLTGKDLSERMLLGSAAAALKCGKSGARAGAPSLRQLRAFLKGNPKRYA